MQIWAWGQETQVDDFGIGFQKGHLTDLVRDMEATILCLVLLLKTSISEPWPPDPELQDLVRVLEATISS